MFFWNVITFSLCIYFSKGHIFKVNFSYLTFEGPVLSQSRASLIEEVSLIAYDHFISFSMLKYLISYTDFADSPVYACFYYHLETRKASQTSISRREWDRCVVCGQETLREPEWKNFGQWIDDFALYELIFHDSILLVSCWCSRSLPESHVQTYFSYAVEIRLAMVL